MDFCFDLFRGWSGVAEASHKAHEVPNLIVGQRFPECTHSRIAISVPDDPEQFGVRPLLNFRTGQAGHARIHGLANIGRCPSILSMAERAVSVKRHSTGIQARGAARRFEDVMLSRTSRNEPVFSHRSDASFEPARLRISAQIEQSGEQDGARNEKDNQDGDSNFHFGVWVRQIFRSPDG